MVRGTSVPEILPRPLYVLLGSRKTSRTFILSRVGLGYYCPDTMSLCPRLTYIRGTGPDLVELVVLFYHNFHVLSIGTLVLLCLFTNLFI